MFSSLLYRLSIPAGSCVAYYCSVSAKLPNMVAPLFHNFISKQHDRLFHNACSPRKAEYPRSHFKYFLPIQTRWNDNDQYGHVNNAVYYVYMDTIINHFHITRGSFEPTSSPHVGLCVSSTCTFLGTNPHMRNESTSLSHVCPDHKLVSQNVVFSS